MERRFYRPGFIAGVIAGMALALVQWAAYLLGVLPFQIYTLTAGIIFPVAFAASPFGIVFGFLAHTFSSGLLGIAFAWLVRERPGAIRYGLGFGAAVLVLLAGFFMQWLTPEVPFWQLPATPFSFSVVSRLAYGAFLGYLHESYLALPA